MTSVNATGSTLVVVAYRTVQLDLSWVPGNASVIVVHNDRSLSRERCDHPGVEHVLSPSNVGFAAAVNAALERVTTERTILCNPDMILASEHWKALATGDADTIVTVPIVDASGQPTSSVNRYPSSASLLLTAYRAGRWAPRGSRRRNVMLRLLGRWGRDHARGLTSPTGTWSLRDYWVSGALLSVDTARLRAAGGLDDRFFLYMEDVDLCRRLADRHPEMRIRILNTSPAVHEVHGSARAGRERTAADALYARSIELYARRQPGIRWRVFRLALVPRRLWFRKVGQ